MPNITMVSHRTAKLYLRYVWATKTVQDCWPCVRKRIQNHRNAVHLHLLRSLEREFPDLDVTARNWQLDWVGGPLRALDVSECIRRNQMDRLVAKHPIFLYRK